MKTVERSTLNSNNSLTVTENIPDRPFNDGELIMPEASWRIFEDFSDPVLLVDTDYRIQKANKAMIRFLNLEKGELLGEDCYKVCHGINAPIALCPHTRAIREHHSCSEEFLDPHSGKPLIFFITPVYDADGRCKGSFHLIKDMTEHYLLMTKLKESRETYRTILDSQTDLVMRLDKSGCITFVNDYGCTFFGKTRKQLLHLNFKSLLPQNEFQMITNKLEALTKTAPSQCLDCLLSDAYGQQYWIQFVCLLIDIDNTQAGVQLVGRDITARKQFENQPFSAASRNLNEHVTGKLKACRDKLEIMNKKEPESISSYEVNDCIELLDNAIIDIEIISGRLNRQLKPNGASKNEGVKQ
jgi:PAS domain S-box-containing protein